jgi:hypothetical protein
MPDLINFIFSFQLHMVVRKSCFSWLAQRVRLGYFKLFAERRFLRVFNRALLKVMPLRNGAGGKVTSIRVARRLSRLAALGVICYLVGGSAAFAQKQSSSAMYKQGGSGRSPRRYGIRLCALS